MDIKTNLCEGNKYGPANREWPPGVPPEQQASGPLQYNLRGPQVEPEASFWTIAPCPVPCVVRIPELLKVTDNPKHDCYFPPYPTDPAILADEIAELNELASLRDNPAALANPVPGNRHRLAISPFLQLRPQPLGAVFNHEHGDDEPVIRTGRELSRWFESETPGLGHRLALNSLLPTTGWSPPRQSLVWMALDVAIHSALLAAWHYKWFTKREDVRFRPRPIEYDYRVSVLFNHKVNAAGSGDGDRRLTPDPSPGTPRHPAYPSGHSTVGGAASEILSFFFPDSTAELNQLADNTGLARLWAGIHWRSDHEQGMKLGRCVARTIIKKLQEGCICPPDVCNAPNPCAAPPAYKEVVQASESFAKCCKRIAWDKEDEKEQLSE